MKKFFLKISLSIIIRDVFIKIIFNKYTNYIIVGTQTKNLLIYDINGNLVKIINNIMQKPIDILKILKNPNKFKFNNDLNNINKIDNIINPLNKYIYKDKM